MMLGNQIHNLAKRLWPINRSITGAGVRETLRIIKEEIPNLTIHEVASGTNAFDWTIPREWHVKEAYIITPTGEKICDIKNNNLHLVGYSHPVKNRLSLNDLQKHLYSLPEQMEAIPYVTSYYKEHWGFCISHAERSRLPDGDYEVVIDSKLFDGSLTYAELIIPGRTSQELLISTYVCHPSMANNELSGPCVTTYLAKKIQSINNKYTYRFIFIPETIGSITYLSKNIDVLKERVIAGFNVSCIGDDRGYSYLPSRNGNTLSDVTARHVLKNISSSFKSYSWSDRGSDERQYCAPGVDLPIASIMRTKYGDYPEYHTSLDNLEEVVTPDGLEGGFNALWRAVEAIEMNTYPKVNVLCEPQLGKRGLYPNLSTKSSGKEVRLMMELITWSDGSHSLIDIAEICNCPIWDLYPILENLVSHGLINKNDHPTC